MTTAVAAIRQAVIRSGVRSRMGREPEKSEKSFQNRNKTSHRVGNALQDVPNDIRVESGDIVEGDSAETAELTSRVAILAGSRSFPPTRRWSSQIVAARNAKSRLRLQIEPGSLLCGGARFSNSGGRYCCRAMRKRNRQNSHEFCYGRGDFPFCWASRPSMTSENPFRSVQNVPSPA